MSANKKYKDSVFTLLFSEKQKLIELYNAIEGTNYTMDTDIEINTLENVLYMDRKNDISFTIHGKFVVLIEHQSSINNNMPLRFLLYIARVYEKMIDSKSVYKEQLIRIPTPEFIVLYNGTAEYPEETVLKLSDAFMETKTALDLHVRVININYGKSTTILEKSKTLKEYSYFINEVNQYRKLDNTLEQSIELAINKCVDNDILKTFLKSNGSEVVNMLFTEFNLKDAKETWEEEGREKGKKAERSRIAISLFGLLDDETVAEKTGLSLEEVQKLKSSN